MRLLTGGCSPYASSQTGVNICERVDAIVLQHTDPFSDLPDFFVTSKKLCIVNQLSTDTMQSSSLGTEPFRRIATS